MRIVAEYAFSRAIEIFQSQYVNELKDIRDAIEKTTVSDRRRKIELVKPSELNRPLSKQLRMRHWRGRRVRAEYSFQHYESGYRPRTASRIGFRTIGFVKNRIGLETSFRTPLDMVYSGLAKMTIFHNLDVIDAGVEIVPVKDLAEEMSTGVSYFEQFVWDLEHRGVGSIDVPVLILGVMV